MLLKKYYQEWSTKLYLYKVTKYLSGVFLLYTIINFMYIGQAFADSPGLDDLQGVTNSLKSDFGKGSTFVTILYLVEIVAAIMAYIKTKNLITLSGVIVISIFINFAIPHWVFRG